jgi:D-hexose-6-phosphate mutarotase
MKIELFTTEVKIIIKNALKQYFNGDIDSIEIHGLYANGMIKCLEELGADVSEEIDTNGWQYDYWIKFKYNNQKYVIDGGGYYGNVKIYVDEDEEEDDDE